MLNLGPGQRTLKKIRNQILHGSLYFYCLNVSNTIINFENKSIPSNIFLTIQLIVRSFVKVLKRYW